MRKLIFVAIWLTLLIALRSHAFIDPGSFWHVTVGERILTSGFPHTDEYTFTFAGEHWIPQQWLAECVMALLHRVAGHDTLLVGLCALLAAVFTGIASRFLNAGLRWPTALALTGLALFVSAFHFFCRPHVFTIALMAWTFAMLIDVENGRLAPKRLLWLLPVCVVWTNLHGGVLAGVFTFGLAAAGWTLLWCFGSGPIRSWRTFTLLGVIGVACLLTTLVNPFGLDLLRTWWSILGSDALKQVVPEHTPLDLGRTGDRAVIAFAGFYLLMLAGLRSRPKVTWLLPLVWLALTVQSIRQGPLFVVVASFAIADMFPHTMWLRLLRRSGDSLARPEGEPEAPLPRWVGLGAIVAAVLVAVGVQAVGLVKYDRRYVPVELLDELHRYAAVNPDGTPIFNDSLYGGFLIYHTPRLRIFIDDRCELYGDEFLLDYVRVMTREPERIEKWAGEYRFDRALVEPSTPADRYLSSSPHWREVARATGGVLYARTD